jgi:hypothetical protein
MKGGAAGPVADADEPNEEEGGVGPVKAGSSYHSRKSPNCEDVPLDAGTGEDGCDWEPCFSDSREPILP